MSPDRTLQRFSLDDEALSGIRWLRCARTGGHLTREGLCASYQKPLKSGTNA